MAEDAAVGQPRAPGEERKIVSVLFVDLVGFTARSDRADPEDVQAALRPYYQRAKHEIEALGGVVEKFIGDAVVGVFGVPASREDDAERAVRSALLIIEGIEELNAANPDLNLAVRAAVNTGEAIVAVEIRPESGEGFVTGDVINTASRLQGVAPEGGVVVGELTQSLSSNVIEYEELEPVEVKGKVHPVPLWLAKHTLTEFGGEVSRGRVTPFVGRRRELDLLSGLWEQVVDERRPRMVTVIGPPGIGKSRLVRELGQRIQEAGRLLRGRCRPYGETTGYDAFGQIVHQVAGIFATDPAAEARVKLSDAVTRLVGGDDVEEVVDHIGVLVGLTSEGNPDKQLLFYSARRFAEALAREAPLALGFEDIHWAAPVLLELLESLAGRSRDAGLLLVTTARPDLLDVRPTWGGGLPSYTAVPLEPLSERDARELAAPLLGQSADGGGSVDRLIEAGGGNPLFLEELATSVAQGAGVDSNVPTSVRSIIAARLDALPKEERRILQDASVIGRVFWRGAVAAISADGARLDLVLDSLEGRDFVRRQPTSRVAGDREFLFKHALTQEVAYGTLPRAARRERHAAIAAYLERAIGDRVKESASLLAYHWGEAGDPARAASFLMMAADVASRAWAKREAIALYDDAISLLSDDGDRELLDQALLGRARTRIDFADWGPEIEDDLTRLITSPDPKHRALALLLRTRAAFWQVDAPAVHRHAPVAVDAARSVGDVDLESRALALLAEAAGMDGELDRGRELRDKALSLWPVERRDGEYAYSLSQAALFHYWAGRYEEALPLAEQAFEAGSEASNITSVINSAAHMGMALTGLSRHEEAFGWFERATSFVDELEQVLTFTGRAFNMWAGALWEIGDAKRARDLNERALDFGKRSNFIGAEVSARIDLLFADVIDGQVERAEHDFEEIMQIAERAKGWHQWLWIGRLQAARAEIALAAGRADDAEAAARESLATALRYGRVKYASRSRTALGRALLVKGETDAAISAFQEGIADAEKLSHMPSLWTPLAGLGQAFRRSGREHEAAEASARARKVIDDFAAALNDERRARFLSSREIAALGIET
jgi:class 3 adenylate cyclase/tetratricopeptide (TPR) repeat protein